LLSSKFEKQNLFRVLLGFLRRNKKFLKMKIFGYLLTCLTRKRHLERIDSAS